MPPIALRANAKTIISASSSPGAIPKAGLSLALALSPAVDLVRRYADRRGHHLRQRQLAVITLLAEVRGQQLRGAIRDLAGGVHFEAQRKCEALAGWVARFTAVDDGDHRTLRMTHLERRTSSLT
jgi:hypothetical protein